MDSWERFDDTMLPNKKEFYSNLNLEDITEKDYAHAQNVWDTFNIKNLGEYHDLYVQTYTLLLLSDIFENFRKVCTEIYQLDPTYFLSAPELAWQPCLKKTNIKLELLTDYDMFLMFEEGIRSGISQARHKYPRACNKYMRNDDKNTPSSYLMYLDANNLYGWVMSKKLPVGEFEWANYLS